MKRSYVPLVLLGAACFIVLAPAFLTGRTLFLRDITYIFQPWRTLTAEQVQNGIMPLWNPYAFGGMPLLGNWQSAVVYPFTLLFYFLPFAAGLKVYHAAHLALAGVFAYLWGRSIGMHRWAAAGVMFVWAFNGYLITRLEFLSQCGALIWLFALLLLMRHPLLAGIVGAMAVCAGHPAAAIVLGVAVLYRVSVMPVPGMRWWAVFAAGTAGLSACQLLPTAELFLQTQRFAGTVPASVVLDNAVGWTDLPHLFNPFLSASTVAVLAGEKFSWVTTFHVGVCAAACMALAFVRPARKRLVFGSALLAGAGIILALGANAGIYPWLMRHLPLFSSVRYPAQWLVLTMAGSAVLTGIGLQRLRYAPLAVACISVELVILAGGFQATAPNAYFHDRGAIVRFLQGVGVDETGRFILSPGTETDRRLPGSTPQEAWQKARGMLYNLTSMPYHVSNAYGSGEPLVDHRWDSAVSAVYMMPTAAAAAQAYRALGIRYLVCRAPLPAGSGFTLLTPHLYAVPGSSGNQAGPRAYFPGWELYVDGKRVPYQAAPGGLTVLPDTPETSAIHEVYRPLSFRAGAAISVLTMVMIMVIGARGLVRRRGRFPSSAPSRDIVS